LIELFGRGERPVISRLTLVEENNPQPKVRLGKRS
jgi:hypothetical protein